MEISGYLWLAWLTAGAFLSAQTAQAPNHLSPDHWKQDVAFFARELSARHKNLYFHLSKAEFDEQIQRLTELADSATDLQMRAGLTRIIAMVGDSHTYVNSFRPARRFDLRFRAFPEGGGQKLQTLRSVG